MTIFVCIHFPSTSCRLLKVLLKHVTQFNCPTILNCPLFLSSLSVYHSRKKHFCLDGDAFSRSYFPVPFFCKRVPFSHRVIKFGKRKNSGFFELTSYPKQSERGKFIGLFGRACLLKSSQQIRKHKTASEFSRQSY